MCCASSQHFSFHLFPSNLWLTLQRQLWDWAQVFPWSHSDSDSNGPRDTIHSLSNINAGLIFYDFAELLDSRILFSTSTRGFPCCDMHVIAKQSNSLHSQARLLLIGEKQISSAKSRESSRHGAASSFWALPLPKWEPHAKIPPQHAPKITWVWEWERVAWGQIWGLAGCWHCAEAHLHVRQLLIPAYFPDKIWIA